MERPGSSPVIICNANPNFRRPSFAAAERRRSPNCAKRRKSLSWRPRNLPME